MKIPLCSQSKRVKMIIRLYVYIRISLKETYVKAIEHNLE